MEKTPQKGELKGNPQLRKFKGRSSNGRSSTYNAPSSSFRSHLKFLQEQVGVLSRKEVSAEEESQQQNVLDRAGHSKSGSSNSITPFSPSRFFPGNVLQNNKCPKNFRSTIKNNSYYRRSCRKSSDTKANNNLNHKPLEKIKRDDKKRLSYSFRDESFYSKLNDYYSNFKRGDLDGSLNRSGSDYEPAPTLKSILKKDSKY